MVQSVSPALLLSSHQSPRSCFPHRPNTRRTETRQLKLTKIAFRGTWGSQVTLTCQWLHFGQGPITWRISGRAEISVRPPGWNFVAIIWRISARVQCLILGGENLQESVLHLKLTRCACLSPYFSTGSTSSPGPSPHSKCGRRTPPAKVAEILQESWSILSRDTWWNGFFGGCFQRLPHISSCFMWQNPHEFLEPFSSLGQGFLRPPFWMRRRPWGRGWRGLKFEFECGFSAHLTWLKFPARFHKSGFQPGLKLSSSFVQKAELICQPG